MKPNIRRCVSCRSLKPKEQLWQIVRVYPENTIQINQGSGRSAYICPQSDCLQVAQKKRKLGRALKVPVPNHLYQSLWERLEGQEPSQSDPRPQRR